MELKSDAFQNDQRLPNEFTCDGPGVSPPLYWIDPPSGTHAFALIADDPDAPRGVFTHWLIYNIPGDRTQLQLAVPQVETMTTPTLQGVNSAGSIGYSAPCPPPGGQPHHYRFTLYALDAPLDLRGGDDRQQVEQAMQGRVLDQARLVGLFSRPG
ncbi:MAG TPA: YbhB/YbcL family Raf kinase inhibitor-like protein [Thermomicrobiaceae bacterium]|nr:YbhB/YbcL family Raf kinase inhibitor-like protein [Thermomicrobiaceae bacterium]